MENVLSFNVDLDAENAIEQLDSINSKIFSEKIRLINNKRNKKLGNIIGKCFYKCTKTGVSYVYVFSKNLYVCVYDGGSELVNRFTIVNEEFNPKSLFYEEVKVCKDDFGFWEILKKCKSSIERIEKLKE